MKKFSIIAFVLFLVLPTLELAVVYFVGGEIGIGPTLLLLVAESLLGAVIVKREGSRAWQALKGALGSGDMPSGELADAALVLFGGALLLTPGFLTDATGFFFVFPLTRPIARRILQRVIKSQLMAGVVGGATTSGAGFIHHEFSSSDYSGSAATGLRDDVAGQTGDFRASSSTGNDWGDATSPSIVEGEIIDGGEPSDSTRSRENGS